MYDFDSPIDRTKTDSLKWKSTGACRSAAYPDVIPMWVADMDFATPPEVVEEMKRRAGHPIYGYSAEPEALYAAYTRWMRDRYGQGVEREWLSFSPGIVPAIATAIRAFTERGDGVAITPPVYHPFKKLIEKNGRAVVEAPLVDRGGRYEFDFGALDAACAKARLLVLCSPHNPIGRVWSRDELLAVAEIAERRDVIVVADEIHADLVFAPARVEPALGLGERLRKRLVSAWAPSKTFNIAGLQASVIVVPDEGLRAAFALESEATGLGGPNCMATAAAATAYERCGPWLDEALAYMRGNYEALVGGLSARAPALKVYPLEGTYLAWIDFRGAGLSGDVGGELVERAGLWLDAGTRFGSGGSGFARLNLGCSRAVVETAADRLAEAFG
ncbi:MAG: pyridoxal phosphate-dependent aminotransferase [Spirochaetes bacterium]|nr:pyridoxal phosphate-dependent aminotransferase [Spirochaetota bacterium]MBU1079067.1 pyridoxal phosphate-dependent aminotransferase [Spirochaetota bacterium]